MSEDPQNILHSSIYRSPDEANGELLEQLTQPRYWDYDQFKKVMIALAATGQYVPAENRPDSIHIQGLRPWIDRLKNHSKDGSESARPVLADIETGQLIAGLTTRGTHDQVLINWRREPGKEALQRKVMSLHVHPTVSPGVGLSDEDFKTFLKDGEQKAMGMIHGDTVFLVLKSSATPNNFPLSSVERRVKEAKADYFDSSVGNKTFMERVTEFNKAMCSEFALTLYIATKESRDLAQRVEVTR